MASTDLSNSTIGTITMGHNDSLRLKLVFMGYLILIVSVYSFNVLIKNLEYAKTYLPLLIRMKGLCLSFTMRPSSMV